MNKQNAPLYMAIYEFIVDNINSGAIKKGEFLPSEQEMATRFKVSKITSKKAYELLVNNGYIKRVRGKGSFIIFDKDSATAPQAAEANDKRKINTSQTIIGVVLPDFDSSYGTLLLSGIESQASQDNIFLLVKRSVGNQQLEEVIIKQYIQLGVDGIIVMPLNGENYNKVIFQMVLDKFPFVIVDRYLKGIPAPFIGSDNHTAAKTATRHLLELGHKRIGFLTSIPDDTTTISERIDGFSDAFAENQMIIDKTLFLSNLYSTLPGFDTEKQKKDDLAKIRLFLENNRDVTCLMATEYNVALLASRAIYSLGLRVPDDISIICFDGPFNPYNDYFYTHIRQNEPLMGQTAVEMLMNQISGQDLANKKILLDTKLVVGQSAKAL